MTPPRYLRVMDKKIGMVFVESYYSPTTGQWVLMRSVAYHGTDPGGRSQAKRAGLLLAPLKPWTHRRKR